MLSKLIFKLQKLVNKQYEEEFVKLKHYIADYFYCEQKQSHYQKKTKKLLSQQKAKL